jgi:RNA polymerase sigma-70 factor, ECF subfamily
LFRIAHNTAIDALRRARVTLVSVDDPAADAEIQGHLPTPPTPPDPVEAEALGRALHKALNVLRYEHRVAVTLRYEEGLPFDEIGQVLGVPEVTARSFVHRARKQLAELLTAGGWQPSGA